MGIKITKVTGGGGDGPAEQPEAGNHEARIAAVVALGKHEEFFKGESIGIKDKIYVVFELVDEQDSKGNNKIVARDYVLSGHEKSNLYSLLTAALGNTDDYDLEKLINRPLSVEIIVNDKGYANVGKATALREAQKPKVGKLDNTPYYWDKSVGEYIEHDWLPWIYSRAKGKRVSVGEMVKDGFADTANTSEGEEV